MSRLTAFVAVSIVLWSLGAAAEDADDEPQIPDLAAKYGCICLPPLEPHFAVLWADGGYGASGTNRGSGNAGSVGLTLGIRGPHLARVRWMEFHEERENGRRPRSDRFETIGLLYGQSWRSGPFFAMAGAGLGRSIGRARGELLYEQEGRRWYRPTRYQAVSVIADSFVGVTWRTVGVAVGATGDANPVRQSWSAQVLLIYGSTPQKWQAP